MTPLLSRMRRSPRLGKVLVAVSLPSIFTAAFAPWWAVLMMLGGIFFAAMYIYSNVLSPKFVQRPRRRKPSNEAHAIVATQVTTTLDEASELEKRDRQLPSFEKAEGNSPPQSAPVQAVLDQTLLRSWTEHGYNTVTHLLHAQEELSQAMSLSTESALALGECIRTLQHNHDQQSQLAKALFQQTDAGQGTLNSLSDLASIASEQLRRQNQNLAQAALSAQSMIHSHEQVLIITKIVDARLDAADKAAGKYALVALRQANDETSIGSHLVTAQALEVAQEYRSTVRDLRKGFDEIHDAMSELHLSMQGNAQKLSQSSNHFSNDVELITQKIADRLGATHSTIISMGTLASKCEKSQKPTVLMKCFLSKTLIFGGA